jgi:hypothetical protein
MLAVPRADRAPRCRPGGARQGRGEHGVAGAVHRGQSQRISTRGMRTLAAVR